ncbi:MAG: hypothetical protein ABFD46_12680 [Armatimonadota bacterium]
MKVRNEWKAILISAILAGILSLLSVQACIAGLTAALLIGYGPSRLRSLPRLAREDAAAQLMWILAASVAAIGVSFAAKSADRIELAALASLASWLLIGVMALLGAFHLTCYSKRSVTSKPPAVKPARDYRRSLPRAS